MIDDNQSSPSKNVADIFWYMVEYHSSLLLVHLFGILNLIYKVIYNTVVLNIKSVATLVHPLHETSYVFILNHTTVCRILAHCKKKNKKIK